MTWTQQAYEEIMRERREAKRTEPRTVFQVHECDCEIRCECSCGKCGCCS